MTSGNGGCVASLRDQFERSIFNRSVVSDYGPFPQTILLSFIKRKTVSCDKSGLLYSLQILAFTLTRSVISIFSEGPYILSGIVVRQCLIRSVAMKADRRRFSSPSENVQCLMRIIIIIIINPSTARVVGVPQTILQPVFSIFPCSPLPSGTWRTPGLSIP